MWYASFIQFGKIDTDTTGQKWLVVFLMEKISMDNTVYIGVVDTKKKSPSCDVENSVVYANSTITNRYSGIANRLITSLCVQECLDNAERFRIEHALWDTGASGSCISERMARKMGLHPVDTGVGISSIGQQDILYYIVDVRLSDDIVFKNMKIAGFPLENHNVDFIIGMDIIAKGNLTIRNNNGKTEVKFSI